MFGKKRKETRTGYENKKDKGNSLVIILNKIDSQEKVTVQSLMDELEISERSVHRYISTLQVAGYPISFHRGKDTYTFDEGYSLRKPNLSVEESLAFALSKKMIKGFSPQMEASLNSIEKKLSGKKADMPRHIILTSGEIPASVGQYLSDIHQAISNFNKIEFVYNAVHSDETVQRKVDPHFLFFKEGFWYLRGYCRQSEAFRTFALDRIASLKVLSEHFLPKRIDPEDEVSASFGAWLDGEPTRVVLIFDKEIQSQILRKQWHPSQKEKRLKDGRLEVKFTVKGLGGIRKWIYQWIPFVEIVEPIELVEAVKFDLLKMISKKSHEGESRRKNN